MGVTLDELLENSGINLMNDDATEKVASVKDAQIDEIELVNALRKYASDENDHGEIRQEAARELSEKTAEIMVIAQTISEINKLASISVDEKETQKIASFIKVALDKGHSEEEIAEFLEKSGGRISRALSSVSQGFRRAHGREAADVTGGAVKGELRLLRDKLIHGGQAEVQKHLNYLEAQIGRPAVVKYLKMVQDEGTRLPGAAFKMLPREASGGALGKLTTGSGKEYVIGKDAAKATAMIGGGLGTGLALRGGSNDKRGRGGPVIING
jgi:hypothetical protein